MGSPRLNQSSIAVSNCETAAIFLVTKITSEPGRGLGLRDAKRLDLRLPMWDLFRRYGRVRRKPRSTPQRGEGYRFRAGEGRRFDRIRGLEAPVTRSKRTARFRVEISSAQFAFFLAAAPVNSWRLTV